MTPPRHRPGWIYETLPYVYAASGLLTMLVLRNAMSIFSGVLLLSAAGLVMWMRIEYRQLRDVAGGRRTRHTSVRKRLPKWLYELLPYGYIASGLPSVWTLRNAPSLFSAVMLMSAGVVVIAMRHSYRCSLQRLRSRSSADAPTVSQATV
jgi:hypothetical protein